MFRKEFISQLRKHNWEKIQNADSNPDQFWRRKRDESIKALKEISFFLSKLPLEKRMEILNYETMFPFIELSLQDQENYIERSYLLLILETLNRYLYSLILVYEKRNEENRSLSKHTIEHLERTRDICSDIINIMMNEYAEIEGSNKNLTYLFKTNGRHINDILRFGNFIRQILKNSNEAYATRLVDDANVNSLDVVPHIYLHRNPNFYKFIGSIYDPFEAAHVGERGEEIGKITINMDPIDQKAHLIINVADAKIEEELKVISYGVIKYFYLPKNKAEKLGIKRNY